MPNKVQPGEHSKGSDVDDISRNSDGDPNLLSANRDDDGQWLSTCYDGPDDKWNRNNGFAFAVSQLSLFLSWFYRRVLFCKLSVPAPKHFTYFI